MNERGQNTIEYLLVVVALLAVMIPILAPNGVYQNSVNNALEQSTFGAINQANSQIVF